MHITPTDYDLLATIEPSEIDNKLRSGDILIKSFGRNQVIHYVRIILINLYGNAYSTTSADKSSYSIQKQSHCP